MHEAGFRRQDRPRSAAWPVASVPAKMVNRPHQAQTHGLTVWVVAQLPCRARRFAIMPMQFSYWSPTGSGAVCRSTDLGAVPKAQAMICRSKRGVPRPVMKSAASKVMVQDMSVLRS